MKCLKLLLNVWICKLNVGITGMLFNCALPRQTLNLFRRCIFTKNLFHLLSSPTFLEEPSLSRRPLHQWGSMKQVWEDKVNSFWGGTRGGERHYAFNRMGTWSQQRPQIWWCSAYSSGKKDSKSYLKKKKKSQYPNYHCPFSGWNKFLFLNILITAEESHTGSHPCKAGRWQAVSDLSCASFYPFVISEPSKCMTKVGRYSNVVDLSFIWLNKLHLFSPLMKWVLHHPNQPAFSRATAIR